jgi:3-oxoacyl-[acyl-carrier protein] reductase
LLLTDKVALVTGAALGIGAGIAELFAREGAEVHVLDVDATKAEAEAASIRAAGGRAHSVAADVSSASQVAAAVRQIADRSGRVDILVNNAGIYPRKPFLETTEAEWDRMQDVNLKSLYLCCREVLPLMREQRYGKIVNISSVTFFLGVKNLTHYVASKGGVIGFTRSLAREAGDFNVHVNCITPGAVKTEGEVVHADPATIASIVEQQSLNRRILPLDIARVALFLCSELSDAMTGQTLNVDGGWVMY